MPKVINFLRSARAGATTLTAAAVTIMTVMGTALIVDHTWLVSKRDILQTAADAGTVATTMRLRGMPKTTTDAAAMPILQETAERYVWLNLASNLPDENDLTRQSVTVTLNVDRANGIVNVDVEAPIGNTLLARIVEYYGPDSITVKAGADAGIGPVWAVLALDTSRSMNQTLDGRVATNPEDMRISIVQDAATDFVETVHIENEQYGDVSIGLVPWAWSVHSVLAPTTTKATTTTAIDALLPTGRATASSRGMKKARELLESAPDGSRKVIVLLTDGQDNIDVNGGRCVGGRKNCPKFRKAECDGAKTDDDITVFTVGAMKRTDGDLANQLKDCASSASYAFINTTDRQSMIDTFKEIAGYMRTLQRTH